MKHNDSMDSGSDIEVITTDPLEILGDLCRVCGKSNDQMIPIFETHEYQLADKINRYLPISVKEQDDLPLHACITCAVTIVQWQTLLESCIKANEKLQQILKKQHRIEQLDINQSSADRISEVEEVGVHQSVSEVKIERVQHQSSPPLPVNGESHDVSGNNCSTGLTTSNQSQRLKNSYSMILSPIYENISEDEGENPIDMRVKSAEDSGDVEIVDDKPKPSAETLAKLKRLKIQKIKDLLKKAQIRVQGKILYHCRRCIKNFSSHIDYVYHIKNHNRPQFIVNECTICGKQFHAKPHLIRHMSNHHLRIKKLSCERCRRICDTVKKNDNDEPDSTTESYKCNICKDRENNRVVYTSATIFATATTSDEDCPKQCDNCKHFFPTESSLRLHVSERSCMHVRNQQITI